MGETRSWIRRAPVEVLTSGLAWWKQGPSAVFQGACARAVLRSLFILALVCCGLFCPSSLAQESPYIVTYDHYLEEPGSLEVEYFSTLGTQRGGNDFHAFWVEFEYGVTAWWTTEVYLDGQTTFQRQHAFHRLSLGKPLPAAEAGAFH